MPRPAAARTLETVPLEEVIASSQTHLPPLDDFLLILIGGGPAPAEALKTRGIFRPEFIDLLSREQAAGHEGYHGYFVWDLAILEEWLRGNGLSV